LRNGARDAAVAEDDGDLPPGMAPKGENDDDICDDAAALFGVDLRDGDGGKGRRRL
jgi:hypothetical protein